MLYSMTAFGRCRDTRGGKDITVEIRSVNSRFFDCSVRLPRSLSFLEERVKPHLLAGGVSRGKVDVYIGVDLLDTPEISVTLDSGYAAAYVGALRRLSDELALPDDISTMTVAQNRELFKIAKPADNAERDWADILPVLDAALDAFLEARRAEGARLEADIAEKLKGLRIIAGKIAELSSGEVSSYRTRLEERLRALLAETGVSPDEGRILTEVAVFADRVAVDEELVRLSSHFDAFAETIGSGGPSGRKLDFLLQEMNREMNTVGSKCSSAAIARLVVDGKCELEKIREQIQNIE